MDGVESMKVFVQVAQRGGFSKAARELRMSPPQVTKHVAALEARVGTRLANIWMHGYFLLLNDAKMAKSTGEFLRVQLLMERGYDPLVYRYLCLTAHYRTQMSFSWEAMDAARTALDRMCSGFFALPSDASAAADPSYIDRFTAEVNDDLNIPRALAVAWEVLRGDLPPSVKRATLLRFDDVLGLRLAQWEPREEEAPADVKALAEARAAARKSKNWGEADRLRGELAGLGWEMEDQPDGYRLKKRG